MTAIAITALMIALIVIAIVFFAEREVWVGIAVVALIALLYIPLIWVGLAVGAKRLRDRDKSAWWLLLFYAVPSILSSAADRMEGGGIILHVVSFAITIWAVIELGFLRGTIGPNRYGPAPLPPPALPSTCCRHLHRRAAPA